MWLPNGVPMVWERCGKFWSHSSIDEWRNVRILCLLTSIGLLMLDITRYVGVYISHLSPFVWFLHGSPFFTQPEGRALFVILGPLEGKTWFLCPSPTNWGRVGNIPPTTHTICVGDSDYTDNGQSEPPQLLCTFAIADNFSRWATLKKSRPGPVQFV